MNCLFPENLLIVKRQLLVHPLHLDILVSYVRDSISSFDNIVVSGLSLYLSLAINAAPKAPMIPAISGLIASQPDMSSKLRNTASL